MPWQRRMHHLEAYEALVGTEIVDRVRTKAARLRGFRVTHVHST
jgi:hypothetical protein